MEVGVAVAHCRWIHFGGIAIIKTKILLWLQIVAGWPILKGVVSLAAIQIKKGCGENVPKESSPPGSQNLWSPKQTPRNARQPAQCRIVAEGRQLSAKGHQDEGKVH
jgi:hypothetical protein